MYVVRKIKSFLDKRRLLCLGQSKKAEKEKHGVPQNLNHLVLARGT